MRWVERLLKQQTRLLYSGKSRGKESSPKRKFIWILDVHYVFVCLKARGSKGVEEDGCACFFRISWFSAAF